MDYSDETGTPAGNSPENAPDEETPQERADQAEEKELERRNAIRLRERRAMALFFLALVSVVLVIAMANALSIARNKLPEFRLSMDPRIPDSETYLACIRWKPWNFANHPIRPTLLIGDRNLVRIPETCAPDACASWGRREASIRLDYGIATSPGTHEGTLVFRRRGAPEAKPVLIPVAVTIEGAWIRNWSYLFWTLVGACILIVLLYVFCFLYFAGPHGRIILAFPYDMSLYPVSLRPPLASYFFPWTRSFYSLRKIFRSQHLSLPYNARVELIFLLRNRAPNLSVQPAGARCHFRIFARKPKFMEEDWEKRKAGMRSQEPLLDGAIYVFYREDTDKWPAPCPDSKAKGGVIFSWQR